MKARRALLGALSVAAVFPAAADAGRVEFDRWAVGLEAARAHWGGWPPCGVPTFEHHATGQPYVAWVLGPLDQPALMSCVIHLSEDAELEDPGKACTTVVHELGHLRGLDHNGNPADVMFNEGVSWRGVWECRRAMHREPYARGCRRRPDTGARECWPIYQWVLTAPRP